MTVAQVWTFRVKPGRMVNFMGWIGENIRASKRLDGSDLSIRVFRRSVSGDQTGLIDVMAEYENMAAAGPATNLLVSEPNYQQVMARGAAEDAPATMISCRLLTDITP
jgi:hypothetical protein